MKQKNICKDFPKLPFIVKLDKNKTNRLIVIGDIHGDLDLAINVLLLGKIIIETKTLDSNSIKLMYTNNKLHWYCKYIVFRFCTRFFNSGLS